MLKRSLSPAPLPPSKRLHTLDSTLTSQTPRTFDTLLYDEIILLIFSYLSFDDLCFAQSVNRNWSRLALDNQLWKSLYIRDYGKQRLRGGKGLGKPMAGREIKPLPGRALLPPGSEGLRDWKRMFKISSNWRTGRCQLSGFDEAPSAAGNPNTDTSRAPSSTTKQAEGTTHILLAGSVTICASSAPSRAPFITVAHASSSPYIVPVDFKNPSQAVQITALAIDQSLHSSQATRFVVCLSSGELVVYELRGSQARTAVYLHHYPGQRFSRRTHPILQAAYHHPLLFTLSESFSLSVYDATTEVMQLVHHLSSFSSFPPASLVLTSPDTNTYKLLITYSSPVYPRHWSLGVTEILMQCPPRTPQTINRSTFSLLSTRSVRAFDTPPGWVDDTRMRTLREQWGRKVLNVAATNSDGKWVVLAPTEPGCTSCAPSNSSSTTSASLSTHPVRRHWTAASLPLQLYRVSFPSGTSATPKLSFVRYLYGQRSPVASLALADGRCVSLGIDGSVWAWDLETAGGVQVRSASAEAREEPFEGEEFDEEDDGAWCERLKGGLKGAIAFDERRIVSSGPSGVVVRDFDT